MAIAEALRSSSGVAMMKATNFSQGDNAAEFGWLYRAWLGRVLLQGEVRSRPVVVAKVAVQQTTKMFLAEDYHVVEEVPPDGSDHALAVRGSAAGVAFRARRGSQ